VAEAAAWCDEQKVPFILNPAPMNAALVHSLEDQTAYLIPNEHELEQLGGSFHGTVVETRGADGVTIHGPDGSEHVAAQMVDAVDTTGAGDCFSGVFAAGIAEGRTLPEAVQRAIVAAAMSVTVTGAREGMPDRSRIDERLSHRPAVDGSQELHPDATRH
jgi:ribokinase